MDAMNQPEANRYLESLGDDLSLALGRAIWSFSVIESATFEYLKKLSTEPMHELMVDQLFKARLNLVFKLVERIDGFESEKKKAKGYLDRAEKLAKLRSAIAHNPGRVWADFDLRELQAEIQPPRINAVSYSLATVRQFTVDAQEVSSGLLEALRSLPQV